MSSVPGSGRRSFDPAAGLRTLATLVSEALTGAMVASAGGPDVAGVDVAGMAIGVSPSPQRSTSRLTGSRPVHDPSRDDLPAGSGGGAAPSADSDSDTDSDTPSDDAHAEVWELVSRAQQGDGEAFGQLYDRYVDAVFRFIYYRVNDRALAEDFTSETFLRALRRIGSISYQGRDVGAWFVTIARNIVFDHMKSARHRLEVTTADNPENNDPAPSPESAVLTTLTNERLMAAVAQLGDEQRECVLLRFIQGFSVSETAMVMGKNDGAVKALQHRAIRKLAELVGGELL